MKVPSVTPASLVTVRDAFDHADESTPQLMPLVQRWTSGGKRVFAEDIDNPQRGLHRCTGCRLLIHASGLASAPLGSPNAAGVAITS